MGKKGLGTGLLFWAVLTALGADPVSDFTLGDLAGHPVRLSDLGGRVVLVNFWATWCPPCRAEFPSLAALGDALKDDPRFVILAVDLQEGSDRVKAFTGSRGLRFSVLLDSQGQTAAAFGVGQVPTAFLVGPDGSIRETLVGQTDWMSPPITKEIKLLLKEISP